MTQKKDTTDPAAAGVALVVHAEAVQLGTLRADGAADLVTKAKAVATPLADVIREQKLSVNIQGREYVKAEGWTTLAAMLGVLPREVSNTRLNDGAYEAVVELVRMSDGQVLVSASAECGRDEPMWMKRPSYARRSMAATRATGKACRLAFSWIVALAGYESTPYEEMSGVVHEVKARDVVLTEAADENGAPVVCVPFGKNKGTPITELEDNSLRWYAESWEVKQTDKDGGQRKPEWIAKDNAFQRACQDELAGRHRGPDDEIPF